MLPNVVSLAALGGPKRDYSPVIDPTTDEAAIHRNFYVACVSMTTHTAPRAIRSFVGVDGADPSDPLTGFVHDAMWGGEPTDKPPVVRASEGVWDITYPTSVFTELASEDAEMGGGDQAEIDLNFRRAEAFVECSDGVLRHVRAEVTGPNTVRVRGWNASNVLDDLAGQVITVLIW